MHRFICLGIELRRGRWSRLSDQLIFKEHILKSAEQTTALRTVRLYENRVKSLLLLHLQPKKKVYQGKGEIRLIYCFFEADKNGQFGKIQMI